MSQHRQRSVDVGSLGPYLSSGLGRYDLVYGSLAAVVALLFWI